MSNTRPLGWRAFFSALLLALASGCSSFGDRAAGTGPERPAKDLEPDATWTYYGTSEHVFVTVLSETEVLDDTGSPQPELRILLRNEGDAPRAFLQEANLPGIPRLWVALGPDGVERGTSWVIGCPWGTEYVTVQPGEARVLRIPLRREEGLHIGVVCGVPGKRGEVLAWNTPPSGGAPAPER